MKKRKILIVDDDHEIVNVLSIILEEENYDVMKVYKGNDAVTSIRESNPDLVLLDYMLPDINGDEVARIVRQELKKQKLPIILISAAHDGEKVAEKAQMDGYIAKPFEMNILLEKIARLLPAR